MDNSKRKENLKEHRVDLDGIESPFLFEENFGQKLIKIASGKQKQKSIFTDLQQKKLTISSTPN